MEAPDKDTDVTPEAKDPTAGHTGTGMKEWHEWKRSGRPEDLGRAVKALSPVISGVTRANPGLSPALLRSKAKTRTIEAIRSFDPDAGAALSTHVSNHLKPLTMRGHRETRAIDRGRFVEETASAYKREMREFEELHGREPTSAEMSDRMGIDPARSSQLMSRASSYEVSESQAENMDIHVEGEERSNRLRLWTEYVYNDLTPRDQLIMDYRMGRNGKEQLGLADIAEKVGVSTTTVHKALGKIADQIEKGVSGRGFQE